MILHCLTRYYPPLSGMRWGYWICCTELSAGFLTLIVFVLQALCILHVWLRHKDDTRKLPGVSITAWVRAVPQILFWPLNHSSLQQSPFFVVCGDCHCRVVATLITRCMIQTTPSQGFAKHAISLFRLDTLGAPLSPRGIMFVHILPACKHHTARFYNSYGAWQRLINTDFDGYKLSKLDYSLQS